MRQMYIINYITTIKQDKKIVKVDFDTNGVRPHWYYFATLLQRGMLGVG